MASSRANPEVETRTAAQSIANRGYETCIAAHRPRIIGLLRGRGRIPVETRFERGTPHRR